MSIADEETNSIAQGSEEDIIKFVRDNPAIDYTFKIHSFSFLAETGKCESSEFAAGGYMWKLVLYPNGNERRGVKDYISVYLAICGLDKRNSDTNDSKSSDQQSCDSDSDDSDSNDSDSDDSDSNDSKSSDKDSNDSDSSDQDSNDSDSSLPPGWELLVIFKCVLYDQNHDKYVVFRDADERPSRLHAMKTEVGFHQLISHSEFKDPRNGYLIDDTTFFGAEFNVFKSTGRGGSMFKLKKTTYNHTWKLENFSEIKDSKTRSFTAGEHTWTLEIYPKGTSTGTNEYLSLYIGLETSESLSNGDKIYSDFTLHVRDQIDSKHKQKKESYWSIVGGDDLGFDQFIKLEKFNDPSKGFLVDDTCVIDVEITPRGIVKKFLQE